MISLGTNATYHGFLSFHKKDGTLINTQMGGGCSQIAWEYPTKYGRSDIGKVKIYFPLDWALITGRNEQFLRKYAELTTSFFGLDVTYTGTFKIEDFWEVGGILGFNKLRGFKYTSDGKLNDEGCLLNRGDLIINNEWACFEVNRQPYQGNKDMRMYAIFCFIRYLYCSNYHIILTYFFHMKRLKNALGIKGDDFSIFQIAHYAVNWFCYNGSYGFMTHPGAKSFAFKLVNLDAFLKSLDQESALNTAFSHLATNHTIESIKQLLDSGNIKTIYERLS